jgi:hypothetical protein
MVYIHASKSKLFSKHISIYRVLHTHNMISMIEAAIITLLAFATGIVIYSFVKAIQYKRVLSKNKTTKGINGLAGSNVKMTCPAGQVITFLPSNPTATRAALICSGGAQGCDAFFQPGIGQKNNFFNPQTTIDVLAPDSKFTDLKLCEGKQTCSWTIPSAGDERFPIQKSTPGYCVGQCSGQIAFIGTYGCVPGQV